jgi:hypothetical protein
MAMVEALPLVLSTTSVCFYYAFSQARLHRLGPSTLGELPLVLALGAGMAINTVTAVREALGRATGTFVRTPKRGDAGPDDERVRDPHPRRAAVALELGLCAWALATTLVATSLGHWWTAIFHGLFATGLGWVGWQSRPHARAPRPLDGPLRAPPALG